jgi:diguanylate cyclase (GGDEF)-like protein
MSDMQLHGQLSIEPHKLARLMPMYLAVDGQVNITAIGATLAKIFAPNPLLGAWFFDVFEVRRPANIRTAADLMRCAGEKLQLLSCQENGLVLRGTVVPLVGQGLLFNLSFGIGIVEAVRAYKLSAADFAPTDLTVEMLYLVEAKTAVLDELRNLNLRLDCAKRTAESEAQTDPLTGLRNRRALDQILRGFEKQGIEFSLMHLDLDYFKHVNDTLGHAAGDHILQIFAKVLTQKTRTQDIVARVGGDEFIVVLPKLTDLIVLKKIADRIIAEISKPIDYQGKVCRVSSSAGMTCTKYYDKVNLVDMFNDADEALYTSKREGRARASFALAAQRARDA